jgi:threonylcarbamoyladenosine tRNA methylthiotransferase MtaB
MDGRIPMHHRREHSRQLQEISDRKKQEFYLSQQGKTRPVLWESDLKEGFMHGFTDNYIRVRRPYDAALVNTITPFRLDRFDAENEVFVEC